MDAIVCSPPYAESLHSADQTRADFIQRMQAGNPARPNATARWGAISGQGGWQDYGHSTGQLGAMKPGTLEEVLAMLAAGVICSPPFMGSLGDAADRPDRKILRPHLPPADEVAAYLRERREAKGLTARQIDARLGTNTLYSWYEGRPAGTQIPTPEHWRCLKEVLDLDDRFDHGILTEVEVEATGKNATDRTGHAKLGHYGESAGQLGGMKPGHPPQESTMSEVPVTTWTGCYDDSWADLLCPTAFSHPAKFARGLAERIVDFMLEQGWLQKGDTVLDPFAGVGCGGIVCASRGLRWVGCELEERFTLLARESFALHRHVWERFNDPLPTILCGDSRHLSRVLQEAQGLVASPPWQDNLIDHDTKANYEALKAKLVRDGKGHAGSFNAGESYGNTAGNLGHMPTGDVAAVLPPGAPPDALVSSPPYEGSEVADARSLHFDAARSRASQHAKATRRAEALPADYGQTDGQLGNEQGTTFWSAAHTILTECYKLLKPGSVSAYVVKAFVRNKQLVDFPGDWTKLLQATGFRVFLVVHASLVKEDAHPSLFGGEVVKRTERKSFFRRLAEKKGSPAINSETVLFARRE